jgi:hypothetical protein
MSFDSLPRTAYLVAIGLFSVALLYQHWQILVAPVPLDLYEGTMPLITGIIAEGGNPYTREFQPQAADVYPPLYNMMVAPLSLLLGNTFLLHRSISAIFILLAAALIGLTTRKSSSSNSHGLAAAALSYAALLFYATPVSSTNAPGVLMFLACTLVPWHFKFSRGSLLFAMVCGLLSFYTKQYFILGMAMVCLYVFLFVSMRRGILLGVVFATLLLATLYVVHLTSPYYLDNTFFAPGAAIHGLQTWEILGMQLRFYLVVYAGLLTVLLISLLTPVNRPVAGSGASTRGAPLLAREGFGGPLLARPINYFGFCFFWATMAIVFWLGRNPGNWMTYLFQLMSPFLILAVFDAIGRSRVWPWVFVPLLVFNFYQSWSILHRDFSVDLESWERAGQLIARSDEVLATQMLVMTLLQHGKTVHQDGHTFYFPLAANKPEWLQAARQSDRVDEVWRDYMTELYRRIERRDFDLVMVSPWEMRGIFERNPPPFEEVGGREFLARHYILQEKIKLSMTDRHGGGTWDVQVWVPRNGG